MAQVAKTQNPQVFEHFENVCEEVGRSPADVFGEMAVRSLDSEHFAEEVLSSEVNMRKIMADEIRLEDVKYVKKLSQEFGIGEKKEENDPIDELINQRIENVGRSPIENISKSSDEASGVDGEVVDYMESLQQEINSLRNKIDEDAESKEGGNQDSEHNEQSVDDLFGGGSESDGQVDEEAEQSADTAELGDQGEQEEVDEEEGASDDGPTDEEIMEAMEGTVESVEDAGSSDDTPEEEKVVEVDESQDDGGPFFVSQDGEEE